MKAVHPRIQILQFGAHSGVLCHKAGQPLPPFCKHSSDQWDVKKIIDKDHFPAFSHKGTAREVMLWPLVTLCPISLLFEVCPEFEFLPRQRPLGGRGMCLPSLGRSFSLEWPFFCENKVHVSRCFGTHLESPSQRCLYYLRIQHEEELDYSVKKPPQSTTYRL